MFSLPAVPVRFGSRRPHHNRLPFAILPVFLLMVIVLMAHAWPGSAWGGSEKPIVIGGDKNFPPYEFLDKNGRPTGFNVELSRAIAEVMGMEVEFRLGNWADARKGLEDGSIDILQGITSSDARSKTLDFSPPHNIVHTSIFARRGTPPVSNLEALRGKEVIVQKGGSMHDFLLSHDYGAKLILVDTHAAALRLLASGKHDYAMVGNLPGLYLGRELGLSNIVPVGQVPGGYYGYAVKKGNLQVLSRFSEGLAILKNTGRYQKIYDKWLGVLEPQPLPFEKIVKYSAMVVVPLLLVLGFTVVWSRTLQKRVHEATAELQQRQQQLIQADKMASLGILVSGVAHEINNPTGLLLLNLPVLKKAYQAAEENLEERFQESGDFMIGGLRYSLLREETGRMFDEMQDGARRIKRIVDDLKDFARKDDSDLNESVDLNAVLHASVRLVENSIKKATQHFQIDCAKELPNCRGNAQRIEQVVVNLILNACQALPSHEKGIFVATSLDEESGELRLSVRDEGVGIPKEHLSHLTDPFFTTKRDAGGTGLGLSVSAGIVKDHGGRLEFDSLPGSGTTVTMVLPGPGSSGNAIPTDYPGGSTPSPL
ncbi:transporter substrate-binding domain-containing protein [Geomonas sp.]|uniref:transporter substrate-binding domain-containing protein n=1 Tax=Geomonas sp. TaxID=2651584 RepID=UPI002B4710E9|nr:transporter substrate-binding domain-containing protein [Geomonas sp.]HJV35184.1 transporter substrate-binding domain-containing protein [Geomonas sp.]